MALLRNVGTLSDDPFILKEVTWQIPNVLSLPRCVDFEITSHMFDFANGTWALSMNPYGQSSANSYSHVDLRIIKLQPFGVELTLYWKIFLRTSKGKEFQPYKACTNFTSIAHCGVIKYLKFSQLISMQNVLAPGGTLTVVCRMHTKSSLAMEMFAMQRIGKLLRICKSLGETLGNWAGETSTGSRNSIEVYTQTEDVSVDSEQLASPDKKFVCDFKELLLNGDGTDVTLQVKGQNFHAHRAFLRARSSVFASMFRHDMKENNTGQIDIQDCDPEYFRDFLHFLYCGRVENLSSENIYSLYTAADKYNVQDLKSECLMFMKSHLDVDNFCDIITLALQHSETDLIEQATDFFTKNLSKIIVTAKWQLFLEENPTQSNDLLIKALVKNKTSD